MKDEKQVMISANEINRFIYCPYQWYYKKTYGNKELTQQYKALTRPTSQHEHYFVKGMKHHSTYHRRYTLKKDIMIIVVIIVLFLVIRGILGWQI